MQTAESDAFCSPAIARREARALWSRVWVYVGTSADVANAGDILPYTVAEMGLHVERRADGGLDARLNRAQYGGCAVIPEQCQAGRQINCPQIACAFSRDRHAVVEVATVDRARLMRQLQGNRPEGLARVAVIERGGLIAINLGVAPAPPAKTGAAAIGLARLEARWMEVRANWKVAAHHLARIVEGAPPEVCSERAASDRPGDWRARFVFPNLVLVSSGTTRIVIVLQAMAPELTRCRISLFVPASGAGGDTVWDRMHDVCRAAEREQSLLTCREGGGQAIRPASCLTADPGRAIMDRSKQLLAAASGATLAARGGYRVNPRFRFVEA
jgi:hypothetical protein